jgi:hypothetical protein
MRSKEKQTMEEEQSAKRNGGAWEERREKS